MGLPSLIHICPDDDVIDHEPTEGCICGPHREPVGDRPVGHHGGQRVIALIHQRLAPLPDAEPA